MSVPFLDVRIKDAAIRSRIDRVLSAGLEGPERLEKAAREVRDEVKALCAKHPLP